jgi:hypothetical protein
VTSRITPTGLGGEIGGPLSTWSSKLCRLNDARELVFADLDSYGDYRPRGPSGRIVTIEDAVVIEGTTGWVPDNCSKCGSLHEEFHEATRKTVNLLGDFISLAKSQDKIIERFAWNFGPLFARSNSVMKPGTDVEPVAIWKTFASDVGVLCEAASGATERLCDLTHFWFATEASDPSSVLLGKNPKLAATTSSFRVLSGGAFGSHPLLPSRPIARWSRPRKASAVDIRWYLQEFSAWWLKRTPVILSLEEGRLSASPVNLNAALAVQFAQLVTGKGNGLVTCSGCEELFDGHGRKPNPKRKSWCLACKQDGKDAKQRKRDQRSRSIQ